tara:strand:+ start:4978 stop:7002 length:2025 start_codon:yes stop_codon:yes gene_type:complete
MTAVSEFLQNFKPEEYLKEEEQKKILNEESKVKETGSPDNLTNLEVAEDTAASLGVGAAKGVTYVVDLPFYLVNAIDSGKDFVFDKAAEAMGFTSDEATEMKSDVEIGLEKADKFLPGKYIRDNFLTYESKSKLGDYAMTIGEYAAPGGLLGKTAKAKALFTGTGAASGTVDQLVTNTTGGETAGTAVGVGTNLLLDLYQLKKGNLAVLSKDLLPSKTVLEKAKKIQSDAKKIDKDFNLSAAEATGSGSVKAAETNVQSTIVGTKVMDKFWTERPDKLKIFIEKWGKQNGIIIQNRNFVSDKDYYNQLKKAAVALSSQRSTAWVRAGGGNLKNFFYDSQKVDNLVIQWKNLAKDLDASDAKTILQLSKKLQQSKGNGQSMHQVYREIRDLFYQTTGVGVKASDVIAVKKYKSMADSLNTLMSTNKDYVKAQKAYIKYNDEYAKPITKGSVTELFKSLEKAKVAEDVNKIGTMWKFLETKAAPSDIIAMAKSLNKSGVANSFENVVTGYINNAFIKSQSKHLDRGLSQGIIFHDAIMKDPRQKANLAQMLFELSKRKDPSVKLADVKNAVNSFANILKATGQGGKVGSQTASNLLFKEQASKNKVDFVLKGFPLKDGFVNWYNDRTFSKNSEIIAKALTSDKGIQAFINLTQDWKDYNSAIALLRAVTVGAGQQE